VAILALGYSLLRTERLHSRCVTVLAWSAVMAAGVAVLALKLHLGGKVPLVASHGGRAVGTFQNPNMAAGFFLLGLFLMPATEWPRSRLVRLASGALVLWAILLTGSNGAKAAVLGGALAYIGYAWVRGGPAPLRALKLLLYLVAIAALTAAMAWALTSLMTRVLPIAAYRIGHLPVSIFDRLLIVRDDLAIWRANPFGVGAGMSAAARGESMAYKQALGGHNEFITMLVERGFVGAIGFLLIIGSGLLMTWRAHGAPVLTGLTRRAPAAYAASFVALLVLGTTHDIIHFRFLWVLLAAIAVHHRLARAVGEQRPGMSDSRARAADDTFTNTDRMSKVT
jgi:O-antigen ligase